MNAKRVDVPRPLKRTEYRIEHHTNEARKGWVDLLATLRNATVDAWDRLSVEPEVENERQYILKGDYAQVTYDGVAYDRWQYKVSDGARIWYFVMPDPAGKCAGVVRLERCMTGHPKQTDRSASAG